MTVINSSDQKTDESKTQNFKLIAWFLRFFTDKTVSLPLKMMESTTESHLPNSKSRRGKSSNLTLWMTFSKTKYALLKLKKSIKHDLHFGDTTMKLAQKISISLMPASTKSGNISSEEMKKERWMQKVQMKPILNLLGISDLNLKILLVRSQRKSMNMNFWKDKYCLFLNFCKYQFLCLQKLIVYSFVNIPRKIKRNLYIRFNSFFINCCPLWSKPPSNCIFKWSSIIKFI